MIIAFKNEVRDVVYISDINKLRFNSSEQISNTELETVSVEMLCVISALNLITNNQNLILNGTIESTNDIADVVFICDRIVSK
jgi:hypothetical protein